MFVNLIWYFLLSILFVLVKFDILYVFLFVERFKYVVMYVFDEHYVPILLLGLYFVDFAYFVGMVFYSFVSGSISSVIAPFVFPSGYSVFNVFVIF